MYSEVEQVSLVDQRSPECADMEEDDRVRQSECVNMNVVALHEVLRQMDAVDDRDRRVGHRGHTGAASAACLPPEIVDALLLYLVKGQEETEQLAARAQLMDAQRLRDTEKAELLLERIEKVKNAVSSLSARCSADMKAFREHMQQNANVSKQRQRELVDLTRKRERLELEVRRTQMEAERLRKIAKHVR
ncbi:hypothetical protein NESM_000565100 [Novymonas esmeraldas]|uniref:Uncharacterized protein n=1 Tax=Novymonas esmeraldas TaxID=1808958 RepID=A0AAW0ERF5_9TRYP